MKLNPFSRSRAFSAALMTGMEEVIERIASATRVLILTGAGVSAESGVPTFRGGGETWRGMPFEQLSSAEMVKRDLPLVWEWFDYRRSVVARHEPNAGHKAIAIAQISGRFLEFTLVTQNIDGLHNTAGSINLIELHGNIHQARCLSCGHLLSLSEIPNDERPPMCPECFDSMRPHVVLFGEALNEDELLAVYENAARCEVCIVVGTSAVVYPANMIPRIAKREGATVIEINTDETELSSLADFSLKGAAGEMLPVLFQVK